MNQSWPVSKRAHLANAQALLATNESASLRQAALELRMCLELMTYDKLNSFEKYLPKSFLERTWQPPQLLQTMLQMDSIADQSFVLHMGPPVIDGEKPQDSEFKLFGEHKAFNSAWMRKHYNKLGSFLHVQKAGYDEASLRQYLLEVCGELEEAQKGSILGMCFTSPVTFTCELCNEKFPASVQFARSTGRVSCLNPNCELEYEAQVKEENLAISPLLVEMECKACRARTRLPNARLKSGLEVRCEACGQGHIIRHLWQYA